VKKLLAIVDDWERLERYEERLKSLFDFHSAPFGAYGIQIALSEHPDVILIDLEFEDMNEEEARVLLRAHDSLKTTPIVFVSNMGSRHSPRPSDYDHVLHRPVSFDQLLSVLKMNRLTI
jgi:DNA-binding response OmpR family regulator